MDHNVNITTQSAEVKTLDLGIVSNKARIISGYGTISGISTTYEQFISATRGEIQSALENLVASTGPFHPEADIVLDIEPGASTGHNFRANYFHELEPEVLEAVVEAYKLRIDVARHVFPTNKIGLYGIVLGYSKGDIHTAGGLTAVQNRFNGAISAGSLGLYEGLDYLCPQMYAKWGPLDEFDYYIEWDDYAMSSTHQTIHYTSLVRKRFNRRIGILPLVSFWVFNGASGSNYGAVPVDFINRQLRFLVNHRYVDGVVLYVPSLGSPTLESIDLQGYVDAIQEMLNNEV